MMAGFVDVEDFAHDGVAANDCVCGMFEEFLVLGGFLLVGIPGGHS